MKITTRITAGYGILILLLAGLVTYEVLTIHRMQGINYGLSQTDLQAAVGSLQLMRDRDLIEEYARKALALGDPDYVAQLKEYQENFQKALKEIRRASPSADVQVEVNRLDEYWQAFVVDLARHQPGTVKVTDFPADLKDDLERLRAQAGTVYDASGRSIKRAADDSIKIGEMARVISIWTAAIALVISALVAFLIYRSISIPLAHLTEGTRAIADGKFYYRLDTSRNDEFSQLAKDFNTMTHRLNELDELKKEFISHVSHEMKAPLASMRETIQLVLEGIPGPLTEKQRRLLELTLQSGTRLTAMISNILDLSRIEAGVMEYELKSQDLVPLVRSAVEELEVHAREKNLTVEPALPENPVKVDCDGDRIIQVLMNLLGNAVKFSPAGGVIQVRLLTTTKLPDGIPEDLRQIIDAEANGHPYALVSVLDCGPGVPDSEKEKVFERFHQVRQAGKGSGQGVGLGLAICRTIVEAHRGVIWVEDNLPHGSAFQVALPAGICSGEGVVRLASTPI